MLLLINTFFILLFPTHFSYMKKFLNAIFSFSFLFTFLVACNGGNNQNQGVEKEDITLSDDYYFFEGFDFSEYGIPATIMIPDGTSDIGAATKPFVEHIPDDFFWNLHVGKNFNLYIEDYGDNKELVKMQKQKLADTDFYEVEYIVDKPNLIVYKLNLKVSGTENASNRVGVKHEDYHVYAERIINGIHYELKNAAGSKKEIIDLMQKSIESFNPIDTTETNHQVS